ncbi:MAG: Tat pathway signal protein [Eggerthellaceae bacterium]|nr:Tat pathway signal protein [Eggerthellaceae bacterium]
MLLTRRHFLYGAAGLAALVAVGAGGYAATKAAGSRSNGLATLKVPEDAVFTSEDCEQIEDASSVMRMTASKELPYGSLVWANDDTVAACLMPTDQARPLATVGLLSLASGTVNTVVKQAVGQDEGFEVYDVRANARGIVWAEADIMDGLWRVYAAASDGTSISEPALVDEGTTDWEMPTLAASGDYAWWQVLPRLDGPSKNEPSTLRRARFGSSEVEQVYSSNGRMSCPPSAVADGVVITPRAATSGTYYQLTRLDAATAEVTDAVVLPNAMRPLEAAYGPTGFNFAFDAIYNYGDGIKNLGTYVPAAPVSVDAAPIEEEGDGSSLRTIDAAGAAAYSAAPWFRFPRTPTAAPAWCGRWLMVKSTKAVCGVDPQTRQYFMLDVQSGADDYGDYLASTGSASRVVTFSNIDYTPLDGEQQRHCLVRVWSATE